MKFIHLADLHLGKKIANYSLLEDQAYILDQIIKESEAFSPDCFLISGDVFDRSLPGEDAIALYDNFVTRCAVIAPVYIIAGNHDSGRRLELFKDPLALANIHIEGSYTGEVIKKEFDVSGERVNIYMLPYFNPTEIHYLSGERIKSYQEAFDIILESLKLNPDEINILLSHQYYTNRSLEPDEDLLEIGNLEEITTDKLKDFDYVALGHLHRNQKVGSERIRYCGSPLKYSVKDHKKYLDCIEMDKDNIEVNHIELKPLREIRVLRDNFENLLQEEPSEDYVLVELTDRKYFPNVKDALIKIFPNLLNIKFNVDNTLFEESSFEEFLNQEPIELLKEFFRSNHINLSSTEVELAQELFDEVKEEDKYAAALS